MSWQMLVRSDFLGGAFGSCISIWSHPCKKWEPHTKSIVSCQVLRIAFLERVVDLWGRVGHAFSDVVFQVATF